MIGGYHVHFMLTMGDWDFWIDWKDRRFWPTVLPIMLVTFPAAAQYYFWEHFRLPFGATFLTLALLTGEWIDRYVSFWGWTFFPITLCWPTSLVPMALYLDIVLAAQQKLDRHLDRRLDGLLAAHVLEQLGDPGSLPSAERAIWHAHELGRHHRLPLRSYLDA